MSIQLYLPKSIRFLFLFSILAISNLEVYAQASKEMISKKKIEIEQLDKIKALENKINYKVKNNDLVYQLIELSRLYSSINLNDKALDIGYQALKLARKMKLKEYEASAYSTLGSIYFVDKEYKTALPLLLKAEKKLLKNKQEEDLTFNYRFLGETYLNLHDTANAITYHQKGLELSRKLNILNRVAFAHDFLGHIYFHKNDFIAAISHFTRSLEIYKKQNSIHRISLAAGNIGLSLVSIGDKREAIHYLTLAVNSYQVDENIQGQIWMNSLIADIYKEIGEYSKALEYNSLNKHIYTNTQSEIGLAMNYKQKGEILTYRGDFKDAERNLNKALKIFTTKGQAKNRAKVLLNISELHFLSADYSRAAVFLQQAKNINGNINDEKLSVAISRIKGGILTLQGQAVDAKKELIRSLNFYKETKSKVHLPFIYKHLYLADSLLQNNASALRNYQLYMQHYIDANKDNFDTERLAYQFEYEKKEAIAKAQLETKNVQRNAAIVGLILASLLTIFIIYFFRLRNKNLKIEKENIKLQKREIEQIKKAEAFKSRFLTNITHEFRTPLTLIKGHLEVIRQKGEFKEVKRLNEMESSSERLLQLINKLMELSKIEEGKYVLQFQKGGLLNNIFACIEPFYSLSEEKKITFKYTNRINPDFNLDGFAYSQEALTTILYNLVSNAIKFTPQNGNIHLVIKNTDSETLSFQVIDTGTGIQSSDLQSIFDRFYQVESEENPIFEGSGIGLAFVKELAHLHQGTVHVASVMGEGTTFTIQLKSGPQELDSVHFSSVEVQKQPLKSIAQTSENAKITNQKKPIILVVEDHVEIRKLIVDHLSENYQFLEAENGREGIELADKHLPDLIISDIMMPDTDGLALCKHLKSNVATSHIPIMILSAKSAVNDKLLGLEIGADDYLTKPFSLEEMKLRIRNILTTRALFRKQFQNKAILTNDENISEFNEKEKEFIERIEKVVFSNLQNKQFGVNELAEEVFLSSSQLNRKLNSLIDTSPARYIRNIRLEKSKQLLQKGFNVYEAATEVGFDDPVYFSKTFKKHFGSPPSHVKN